MRLKLICLTVPGMLFYSQRENMSWMRAMTMAGACIAAAGGIADAQGLLRPRETSSAAAAGPHEPRIIKPLLKSGSRTNAPFSSHGRNHSILYGGGGSSRKRPWDRTNVYGRTEDRRNRRNSVLRGPFYR